MRPPFRTFHPLAAFALLAFVASGSLIGCDAVINDDFEAQTVVSAFLGAGEPMSEVRIRTTSPFLDPFDPDELGVDGADVSITLLAPDGSDEATVQYRQAVSVDEAGVYVPSGTVPDVLPERTYRLDVVVEGERITALTTVPPALETVGDADPSVVYGDGNGPGGRVTQSTQPGGRQAAFVGSTRALDPSGFEEVTIDGETR